MRAGLAQREPARVAHWERTGLYEAMQRRRQGAPAFVLHDGPPFTNGDVHIGTALNKTLKDVTVRYKSLRGFRAPYVPGWDCHGLPIEQKVARELRDSNRQASTSELRQLCDAFSEVWIAKQKEQFKRLGVLADWANEYKTKAPSFEADILRTFASFVEKGVVYRSKKPVYWSIPFETALAEAEVEYKDHSSPSIWVRFPIPAAEAARFGLPSDKPLSIIIWTTTPWTLPANLAVALNPDVDYVVADTGSERIIVAAALLAQVAAAAGLKEAPTVTKTLTGKALEHLAARHPFIDRPSPVVLADYVTTDSGTGAVHTAPGHGAEDYLTGLKYGTGDLLPGGRQRRLHRRRPHTRGTRGSFGARERRGPREEEDFAGKHSGPQEARRRGGSLRKAEVHPQLPALLALKDAHHLPGRRPVVRLARQGGLEEGRPRGNLQDRLGRGMDPRMGRGADPRRRRVPSRLVRQPPALMGCADPGVLRLGEAPLSSMPP